jgi:hypothetical protein
MPPTLPLRQTLGIVYLAMLGAGLLNAPALVERVARAPEGEGRALGLALVEPLAESVHALGLDRPRSALRALAGREGAAPLPPEPPTAPVEAPTPSPTEAPAPSPTPSPTEAPTEAPPRALRGPTAEEPLRVWVFGDSLINMAGPRVEALLEATGLAQVQVDSRPNTGLVRPDYFDWPAALRGRLAEGPKPEAVLVLMGANDGQNVRVNGASAPRWSAAWSTEYERRAGELMALLTAAGAEVWWVGLPGMKGAAHQRTADALNAVLAAEAERHPSVHFVPTEAVFSLGGRRFSLHLLGPTGARFPARAGDGVHFTWSGSRVLAAQMVEALCQGWPVLCPPPR